MSREYRERMLVSILAATPGRGSGAVERRLHTALRLLGRVTYTEAERWLDIADPYVAALTLQSSNIHAHLHREPRLDASGRAIGRTTWIVLDGTRRRGDLMH